MHVFKWVVSANLRGPLIMSVGRPRSHFGLLQSLMVLNRSISLVAVQMRSQCTGRLPSRRKQRCRCARREPLTRRPTRALVICTRHNSSQGAAMDGFTQCIQSADHLRTQMVASTSLVSSILCK